MNRFIGKVAVVTGCGSGIGAAVAEQLVKVGVNVVGLDICENKLKNVAAVLEKQKYSGLFSWKKCDVCKRLEVEETFSWVNNNVGPIWILVNSAGILIRTTLLDADDDAISKTLDTNVKGLLLCAQKAMNLMMENSVQGHIININSINGHYIRHRPDISKTMIYAASKHAVTVLTEGLRREALKRNLFIKCSSISPGHVETNLSSEGKEHPVEPNKGLQPESIARACISVLSTSPTELISELTIMAIHQEI